jgi:hypothetical protein
MKLRRCLPAVLLFLAATGLAQEPSAHALTVIDLRPAEQRQGNELQRLTGKCNDDIYRIPETASAPRMFEQLKLELTEQLGISGDDKTLTVLSWAVYYNTYVKIAGPSLSSVGVQGYSLPGQKKKDTQRGARCSRGETAGGWYEGNDVTGKYPPLVSEFQGTFGGKLFSARVVHSPSVKLEGKFEGAEKDTEALLATIHQTAEAVVAALSE